MKRLGTRYRRLRGIASSLYELVVTSMPGPAGDDLRRRMWGRRVRHLGRNVRIGVGAQLVNPQYITLRDNCWIDRYAILLAGPPREGRRLITRLDRPHFHHGEGELVIGANCHIASHAVVNAHGGVLVGANTTIAAGAKVVSVSHHHSNPGDPQDDFPYRFGSRAPDEEQSLIAGPIVIGDNAALATNSVMAPGSSIGHNSWVGACSFVSGAIPDDTLAWGTPARPVRSRRGQPPLEVESA